MNRIKSWFAISYWWTALAIVAVALFQLSSGGMDATWLGAILTTLPFVGFFGWLSYGKIAPRSSPRLPVLTIITLAGLGLATYGYLHDEPTRSIGYASALLAAAGFLLFTNWYSIFNRPINSKLSRGAMLPSFEAQNRRGEPVTSDQLRGLPALLLFYRGNWCPICLAQVEEVAARYRDLIDRGVQVVLISPQPHDLTERVADLYDVPFEFWVDPDARAAAALDIVHVDGVPVGSQKTYGKDTVLPTAVIVDAEGKILYTDQANNFRIRPDPDRFVEVLAANGY